jgi:hypothetical protein
MFHARTENPEFEMQLKIIGFAWEIKNTFESPFPLLPSRNENHGSKNNSQAPYD